MSVLCSRLGLNGVPCSIEIKYLCSIETPTRLNGVLCSRLGVCKWQGDMVEVFEARESVNDDGTNNTRLRTKYGWSSLTHSKEHFALVRETNAVIDVLEVSPRPTAAIPYG